MPDGVSYPPEQQVPGQTPPAQVYNPAVQDEMVSTLHPAAQYAYERAMQTGAHPQEALQKAQEQQNQMIQRATDGQDIEGIQQPVIGLPTQGSFVSAATIKRVTAALAK